MKVITVFVPLYLFVGIGIFLLVFLGDMAISFSSKRDVVHPVHHELPEPFSHRLGNELSSVPQTYLIDSIFYGFIAEKRVKGASVAISHNGKLVYAKGFGYADLEEDIFAEPKSLFRIASISKLLTGVAVMKLSENGQIGLDKKVFGPDGILYDTLQFTYSDPRVADITIMHLLNHTAGWNSSKGDPIFNLLQVAKTLDVNPQQVTIEQIIGYQLTKKLEHVPGEHYSYFNFGYALLGYLVEQVTGMRFQDYVHFAILHPLGIYDMHLGGSFYQEKLPHEVRYYDADKHYTSYSIDGSGELVPMSYGGNNIELLGPAGGWVASAPELMKLLVSIDGFADRPDILNKESIATMTTPYGNSSHLIGWRGHDGRGNWWRTGTLTGTTTLMMRQWNGINWVVLMNTTTDDRASMHNQIAMTMFKATSMVKEWPLHDLFNR